MASSVITPEDVLESLMNDGTIDAIRLKIINQLKGNEELKNNTITMVERSKVLNTTGAEKQTKRELFDSLRKELESPVLEKASKAVWELILDGNGLGKEISDTVERVYRRLSGLEPSPQSSIVVGPEEENNRREIKDESEKLKEADAPSKPSTRKRSLGELLDGAEAATDGLTAQEVVEASDNVLASANNLAAPTYI